MRILQVAFLATAVTAAVNFPEGSILRALEKKSPNSEREDLQSAAKWLEDNFGASTAEDLNGVSNFAVDAMSLADGDKNLRPAVKELLDRLFKVEIKVVSAGSSLDVLKKEFPDARLDVLKRAAKWLEANFGASTAEDLDGVSEWAVNGMKLAADDGKLNADTKRALQLFFQGQSAEKARRRLNPSTMSSSTTSAASTTTTTTTTTVAATTTTTTTTGPTTTTTTTTGPTTTTTTGPTTTTTTTTGPTTTTTTTTVTTTTTTTVAGRVYQSAITFGVGNTTAFLASPQAHTIMKDAIVASSDATNASQVNIISLGVATRRLEFLRRLASGNLKCDFTIKYPETYTGVGPAAATFNTTALKSSIESNPHITVTVDVTSFVVATAGCAGSTCPTTTTTTTTVVTTTTTTVTTTTTKASVQASTGGAVTAQQLAASIVAMVLLKMFSGL